MELFLYYDNNHNNPNLRINNKEVIKMKNIKIFFRGFKNGMGNFGKNVAIIVNSILLLIVYLIGVGATSLIARIFKKHFLDLKISEKEKTYWSDLNLKKRPIQEYYRQF